MKNEVVYVRIGDLNRLMQVSYSESFNLGRFIDKITSLQGINGPTVFHKGQILNNLDESIT